MREHNDANVVAFGAKQMDWEGISRRLGIFLEADYLGGYHASRVSQLGDIEEDRPLSQTPFENPEYAGKEVTE